MAELTNRISKLVRSLSDVKGRRRNGLFVAEGTKCVTDTAAHFKCRYLIADSVWLETNAAIVATLQLQSTAVEIIPAKRGELQELTSLTTTPPVIAVYELPVDGCTPISPEDYRDKLVVALDCIQDPGNLGTIIRTCDWMGIDTIIASTSTVDSFNPKTVQATMGAISRVKVIYTDLAEFFKAVPNGIEIYGTFLNGENIYTSRLSANGIIIMGNEGKGISPEIGHFVTRRILIPSYPPERTTSESLNVATATAITLAQFRSKMF